MKMARNSEKRLTGLNRFLEAKQKEGKACTVLSCTHCTVLHVEGKNKDVKRPPLVSNLNTNHSVRLVVADIFCSTN